jgi:hypothetical protein
MPIWLWIRLAQPYIVLLLHAIELFAMIERMGGRHRFGRLKRQAVIYARRWNRR